MLKKFKDLTEKEILAIAIAAEEEDGRIYGEFADALRDEYPSTAQCLKAMREEEVGPPRPLVCDVPAAFRRPHSADPPRKRKGISAEETGMAGFAHWA